MLVQDKRSLWQDALTLAQEQAGFEVFTILQNKAYLDSIEQGVALIGAKSWTWVEVLEKKRIKPLLENVLSELLHQPIRVKLVVGRPRIIEKASPKPIRLSAPAGQINWSDPELGTLFEQYGDIMGIVDNHPVFMQATKPIAAGGWGIFPAILTNACKDYGVIPVLNGLRDTATKPRVTRPRAYFLRCLKSGVYGHKLAMSASIIGPISGR